MKKDNVVRLDRRRPFEARPMREEPIPPRQQRPFLVGLRGEASRDANWMEAELSADPRHADLSLDALLARARLRRATRVLGISIDDRIITRSRQRSGAGRNPFELPKFPPNVTPRDRASQMAMDEAGEWSWGNWALNVVSSTFAEGMSFPGYSVLAEQAQRPEYRKFAEIIANEMTRKWIKIKSTSEDEDDDDPEVKAKSETTTEKIAKINKELERVRAKDAFRRCVELDEFFGRSHLYIDTGDTENRDELKMDLGDGRNEVSRAKFGKGDLEGLRAVEPVWVYPTSYTANDPLRDDWYNPQTWFVLGKEVHKSRLLRFVGREVPDLLKPAYSFGGLSMTQMARPYVDNWLRTRQAVADIVHAYSVFVLKTNFTGALADGGDLLFRRAEVFNNLRDNRGLMMLDKETEDFQNVSANISGLEGLQAQSQEQLCSVAGIPVVKYLGIQPTGLNASDEGGIRVFYDWVLSQQEKRMRSQLTTVIDFVQLSLFGEVDPDIVFDFEPLRELSEKEEAELDELHAKTDVSYIDVGVLAPAEVRKKIASDPDSPYSSIDVDDVPDLPQEEAEGLDPRAGKGVGAGKPPHPQGGPEGQGAASPEIQGAAAAPGEQEETKDAEPPELSAWQQRLKDHDERHARRDTEFHRRADARDKRIQDEIAELRREIEGRIAGGASRDDEVTGDAAVRESGEFAGYRDGPSEIPPDQLQGQQPGGGQPPSTFSEDADFKEADHPRDADGKFGSGAGGGGAKTKVKGTTKERVELRGQIREEKDPQKRTELKERLADSYRHALETARKAGNQAKIEKFQSRLQKLGAAHGEIGGSSTSTAHVEALKKAALDVARRRGFRDLSRIKITDERKTFTLNGRECLYAGGYHIFTGEITLYTSGNVTPEAIPGIIAHEVMHDKWNFVRSSYQKQHSELMKKLLETQGVRPNPWMRSDGSLGPEAKKSKKFAIYEAMHDAFDSVRPAEFSSTDGVTPYSRQWWTAYASGQASLDTAVDETLAEMSMELHRTGEAPSPSGHRWQSYKELHEPARRVTDKDEAKSHRAWKRLFDTVEKLYEKHAPHEGFR